MIALYVLGHSQSNDIYFIKPHEIPDPMQRLPRSTDNLALPTSFWAETGDPRGVREGWRGRRWELRGGISAQETSPLEPPHGVVRLGNTEVRRVIMSATRYHSLTFVAPADLKRWVRYTRSVPTHIVH